MRILFSDHAELKVRQRKLSRERVVDTVLQPDFRHPSYSLREAVFKKFGKNFLKVVTVVEGNTTTVVTAHWIAKMPKKS